MGRARVHRVARSWWGTVLAQDRASCVRLAELWWAATSFVSYSVRSTRPIDWPAARSAIRDNHSAWHACTHRIENAHPCGCREGDRGRYNLVIEITSEPASLL